MSHFLYGHKDLTAEPDVWKVGKSLTPWSAVRLRQRHCWNTVGLDYLFFGRARHIDFLENQVKRHFEYRCGSSLVGNCRTELFKVPEQELFDYIRDQIKTHELHVNELVLKEMYSATSAGQCPFGVPSEDTADHWCEQRVLEMWGKDPDEILRERLFVWEQ
jgi:hypothetical protein